MSVSFSDSDKVCYHRVWRLCTSLTFHLVVDCVRLCLHQVYYSLLLQSRTDKPRRDTALDWRPTSLPRSTRNRRTVLHFQFVDLASSALFPGPRSINRAASIKSSLPRGLPRPAALLGCLPRRGCDSKVTSSQPRSEEHLSRMDLLWSAFLICRLPSFMIISK